MATRKSSGARKSKSKEKKAAPTPFVPAVPPPDDPLRRFQSFDANHEFHSEEMAKKRLEAIRYTQQMPTSEEEPPTTEDESSSQTATPEQTTSNTQSDSTTDED